MSKVEEIIDQIKKETDMVDESFEEGVLVDNTPCLKCGKTPSIKFGEHPLCQDHAKLYIRNKRMVEAMEQL